MSFFNALLRTSAIAVAVVLPACLDPAFGRELLVSSPSASPIEPAYQTFREEEWAKRRTGEIAIALQDGRALQATNVLFIGDSITQL